jgi:hypothetical protein
MTQVFISYSRKDLAFVERLAEDLKAAGLEVWYDLSGLDGGTRWGREIQSAIQQSQIFVVVLSPNSIDSEWVEKEFMYANSLKRKIIPLLLQPCETHMWFINLHFIDVQGVNYDSHFWVILKAMGVKAGDAAAQRKPAGPASVIQPPTEPPLMLPQERQQEKKESPRPLRIRPAWIVVLIGLVALIAFAVWGMPALAARLAPTRTPTPTALPTDTPTLAPTFTPTIPAMPTQTIIPSPTLTPMPTSNPTTGTVNGSVLWASRPMAGVAVKLCTNWLYTCKGTEFSGVTGADGIFRITGVSPGEYQVITKYPGQSDETRAQVQGGWPLTVTISAGDRFDVDTINICKTDLFLYSPAISNNGSTTFSWKPYPEATGYFLTLSGTSNGNEYWNTTNNTSFKVLQPGNYQLVVSSVGPACAQGIVNFTVPQPQ